MNELPTSQAAIELAITTEILRQAHQSHNLARTTIMISFGLGVVAVALLFVGKVPEGMVTSMGGLVTTVQSIRFAKDANQRLDRLLSDLHRNRLG